MNSSNFGEINSNELINEFHFASSLLIAKLSAIVNQTGQSGQIGGPSEISEPNELVNRIKLAAICEGKELLVIFRRTEKEPFEEEPFAVDLKGGSLEHT